MCTSIVGTGYGTKSLMTGCVPDLKLDLIPVVLKGFEPKIHSNGSQEDLAELIIGIADYD